MSLGINAGVSGLGGLLSVSALAWKTYKACKESSDEFKAISTEVSSLHIVLKEIEENLQQSKLRPDGGAEILRLGRGCSDVLRDLEALLSKYKSLSTQSQRTWDRMRFGWEDINALRVRLVSNITLLTAFNTSLIK